MANALTNPKELEDFKSFKKNEIKGILKSGKVPDIYSGIEEYIKTNKNSISILNAREIIDVLSIKGIIFNHKGFRLDSFILKASKKDVSSESRELFTVILKGYENKLIEFINENKEKVGFKQNVFKDDNYIGFYLSLSNYKFELNPDAEPFVPGIKEEHIISPSAKLNITSCDQAKVFDSDRQKA